MDLGRIGTRELGRRSSSADIACKPAPNTNITQGRSVITPDFQASKPVTVERQERLPLAPLQCVTTYEKRNIAEFLTFAEAISLMLSSRDLHLAIRADPWLRLDEISPSFQRLGVHEHLESIQSLEAEISQLQRQFGPGAGVAEPPADKASRGISFAGLGFRIRRAVKESPGQAQVREKTAQKVKLSAKLEPFEPAIEDLVIHFASERQKEPRPVNAAAHVYAPRASAGRLRDAIDKGDVKLIRAGMRELLSLPERLMPNARKLAWLREALKYFGKYRCGEFKPSEIGRYEAIIACVDEIVSSKLLSKSEKSEFFNKVEPLEREGRVVERDIFGYALFHSNPAVAASILLGIHGSSAVPDQLALKQSLLAEIGVAWGGLHNCVDCVADLLRRYEFRAPDWVNGVTAGLRGIPTAPPLLPETKEPFGTPGY